MSIALTNIGSRNRLRLRGFKNSPERKIDNVLPPPMELITPPDESFIEGLERRFKAERISLKDKVYISFYNKEEQYYLDERAGIYEYEGGLSREKAEERALYDLLRNTVFKLR